MRRTQTFLLASIPLLIAGSLSFATPRAGVPAPARQEPTSAGATQEQANPLEQKYGEMKADVIGSPEGGEQAAAGGGRVRLYSNGAIYWSKGTGAHTVLGAALQKYREAGGEAGELGYPVSDDAAVEGGGREVVFQHGIITVDASGGAASVRRLPWVTFTPDGAVLSGGAKAVQKTANTALLVPRPQDGQNGEVTFSCGCNSQRIGNCTVVIKRGNTVQCTRGTCTNSCTITVKQTFN